jgi:hypothetical protein
VNKQDVWWRHFIPRTADCGAANLLETRLTKLSYVVTNAVMGAAAANAK